MAVFGIEVASDDELRKLDKGISVEQIYKTIEILRKNDIAIVGDIMIGFNYDDEAIIKRRFEFADQVDPSWGTQVRGRGAKVLAKLLPYLCIALGLCRQCGVVAAIDGLQGVRFHRRHLKISAAMLAYPRAASTTS